MSTITTDTLTITPTAVVNYAAARAGGNVIHDIIGREEPDVTLRPAGMRRGTLEALFYSEADSSAAEAAIATAGVMTLDDDVTTVEMSFVLGEAGVQRIIDDSRTAWLLTIDYVEVEAS